MAATSGIRPSINTETPDAWTFGKAWLQLVSLDEALADSTDTIPDRFVGTAGISWIDHEAFSLGKKPTTSTTATLRTG